MANVIKHKRGSGSDPAANNLVLGELAIRTDVGKLFTKMDSGAIAEIAGGGSDIAINTLSSSSATGGGSATFNGSAYRFTLSAPPSVSAAQLLVSINGVIQKPVAGTGQPSEGFSVSGNDIILGDAPATGADFFILTFKSLGVSEPADNSVTSAKIVDGAIVNADINASAAIAGSKIDPTFTSAISTSANEITISGGTPKLNLTDTGNNPDYVVANNDGQFRIRDATNSANRLTISSDGTVDINGNLDVAAGIDVTGAITGTGDMTIDTNTLHVDSSNNRVGIGTTSPSQLLHLKKTGANALLFVERDSGALGFLEAQASKITLGSSNNHPVHIVQNSGDALMIDSSKNVGIGTTSPDSKLRIVDGSDNDAIVYVSGADTTSEYVSLGVQTGKAIVRGGGAGSTNTALVFEYANAGTETEGMRLDSSGNVGIGVSSPDVQLDINGDASSNTQIRLRKATTGNFIAIKLDRDASGTAGGQLGISGASGHFVTTSSQHDIILRSEANLLFGIGQSEKLRIDSSGNVGIGTSSPVGKLHVNNAGTGSGDHAYAYFTTGDTGASVSDGLTIGVNATATAVVNFREAGALTFGTSNTERMRINSSGNVGIGTSSPRSLLDLGAGSGDGSLSTTLSQYQIMLEAPQGTGDYGRNIGWSVGTNGLVAAINAVDVGSSDATGLTFITGNNTAAAERMRIDSGGRIMFNMTAPLDTIAGSLNISGGTSGGRIAMRGDTTSAGAGIAEWFAHWTTNKVAGFIARSGTDTTNKDEGELAFYTKGTNKTLGERLTITQEGNVGIGTTSPSETLTVTRGAGDLVKFSRTGTGNSRVLTLQSGRATGGTTANMVAFDNASGTNVGTIRSNVSSTSFNTSSDYRLKENATAISNGITRLKTLKPYRFNFITEPDRTVDGFFAHEVTTVPEAITGTKDEVDENNEPVYQGIDQSKLVPLLVAALQEAIGRIEALEAG